ncbi:MAG: 2,3-bisphosphoglycerate-independent phosphoglycerate mutase [Ferroplasma sp.]
MKKVVLLIMDGLGDRPNSSLNGKTALQSAEKPNLDYLALNGTTGTMSPVSYGIRAGSDTSHLSILGYDPEKYYTGRGPFEALGLGMDLKAGDIAFRANYASVIDGKIVDRRAGRIMDTEELSRSLETEIDGIKFMVKSGVEHRAAVVMRGKNLSDKITDTDPHKVDSEPLFTSALDSDAEFTAKTINKFLEKSRKILESHPFNLKRIADGKLPGNEIMLRGCGRIPELGNFQNKYGMRAACISGTPLIRGIAGLAGFDIINVNGMTGRIDTNYENIIKNAIDTLETHDFVLINIKGTDIAGHDKKPELKKYVIEKVDHAISHLIELRDQVLIVVTGDHSTPCSYGDHTGDPVPVLFSTEGILYDNVCHFDELSVGSGYYKITSNDLMPIIMSYSDRAEKYGA